MRYFAYGSNLLVERIRLPERVPGARPVGVARLEGWWLSFHKRGRDGSGKATIHPGVGGRCVVHGLLYEMSPDERRRLDADEGPDYATHHLEARTTDGPSPVWTYVAREACLDPALVPFGWYHALVVAGARRQGFPAPYIANLEAVPSQRDPDPSRARRMWGVLTRSGWPG